MSAIRIAARGWNRDTPAKTAEEVTTGIGVWWVEVDGCRIRNVLSAAPVFEEGVFGTVTIVVTGPVEIVYVDGDGEPLPGSHSQPSPEEIPEVLQWGSTIDSANLQQPTTDTDRFGS